MVAVATTAVLIFVLLLSSCRRAATEQLTVFAASSLTDAFTELAAAFEAEQPDVDVLLNFAGSSQLAAQLQQGAPADVFASANEAQMAAVVMDGRIESAAVQPFTTNLLTLITPHDNPARITALDDLAQPGVLLILAAPGVPVRAYTDQIIATLPDEVQVQLYANIVSEEENVRQVAAKIALGEAEAGIVYGSDVTPDLAPQVQQVNIPATQNIVAVYPIAPLRDAPNPVLAQQFVDFILSDKGQAILRAWGFGSEEK